MGELRDPETHLIPRAMMSIQGYFTDFAVFGSDYPTPDGTAIRDYIHVADLADAHVAALRRLLDGKPGGAYNLGTGRGYSVKQVLEAIAAETGETLRAPMGLRREGDPAELVADASLGRRELGWSPHLSDLETIVRTAWAWHRRAHPRRDTLPPAQELSAVDQTDLRFVAHEPGAPIYELERQACLGCRPRRHGGLGVSAAPSARIDCTLTHCFPPRPRSHAPAGGRGVDCEETQPQAVFLAAAKVGGIVANRQRAS